MKTTRNEETEAGRKIWRMVDDAAKHAPLWVQDNITALIVQHLNSLEQQQNQDRDKKPEAE